MYKNPYYYILLQCYSPNWISIGYIYSFTEKFDDLEYLVKWPKNYLFQPKLQPLKKILQLCNTSLRKCSNESTLTYWSAKGKLYVNNEQIICLINQITKHPQQMWIRFTFFEIINPKVFKDIQIWIQQNSISFLSQYVFSQNIKRTKKYLPNWCF